MAFEISNSIQCRVQMRAVEVYQSCLEKSRERKNSAGNSISRNTRRRV